MRVYIGFDPREEIAAAVCASSIRRYSDAEPLYLKWDMPAVSRVYTRPYSRKDKQYIDGITQSPFSTQFSFTRFLIPYLEGYQGWALFCDGDVLFLKGVDELHPLCDSKYAVRVVKHEHNPPVGIKMDGVRQTQYFRKNWSSFVLWNCGHPSNRLIGPYEVNTKPGKWLHAFSWLKDEEIGELPEAWNYLVGHDQSCLYPNAVHFTEGGPWWKPYQDVEFSEEWRNEMLNFVSERQNISALNQENEHG